MTVHLNGIAVVTLETTTAEMTSLLGETATETEAIVIATIEGTSRRRIRKTKTRKQRKRPPSHQDKR